MTAMGRTGLVHAPSVLDAQPGESGSLSRWAAAEAKHRVTASPRGAGLGAVLVQVYEPGSMSAMKVRLLHGVLSLALVSDHRIELPYQPLEALGVEVGEFLALHGISPFPGKLAARSSGLSP